MNLEMWQVATLVIGAVCGPAGAAYVGVKVGLNGVRGRVEKIERVTDHMQVAIGAHGERLVRIETKLERP